MKKPFKPKNIAIMYRPGREDAVATAKELANWLVKSKFKVFSAPKQKLIPGTSSVDDKNLDSIDWVIALGGDGTYLRAVQMLDGRQTPILGVNLGGLGFLTEIRVGDLKKAVQQTLNNEMDFRPRAMLEVQVKRKGKVRTRHLALNDAVIERGPGTHLISIAIYSEKHLVGELKADALIVASPTGSTAYNLAAGGPILHPEVRAIVCTPVCPHALTSRPLLFPDDKVLSFKVLTKDKPSILTVDGMNCGELSADDEITIVRSKMDHFVIRRPEANYFELLREKLSFGERD